MFCKFCGKSMIDGEYCGLCVDIMQHMSEWKDREKKRGRRNFILLGDKKKYNFERTRVEVKMTCACGEKCSKFVRPSAAGRVRSHWKYCFKCAQKVNAQRTRARYYARRRELQDHLQKSPAPSPDNA